MQQQRTHPLLQQIPLRLWTIEHASLQVHRYFAQKVIPSEHVRMPHGQPQRSRFQAAQRHMETERFVEHRIECVLFHFGLAFARLGFVGQQVELKEILKS